jgi:hypothetical protein
MDSMILIPLITGVGFIFWANDLKEEHPFLALLLQLMFIPLVFLSIHLAVIQATILYSSNAQLVTTLTSMVEYLSWILFGIGAYYLFIAMGRAKDMVMKKRQDDYNKKYGDD